MTTTVIYALVFGVLAFGLVLLPLISGRPRVQPLRDETLDVIRRRRDRIYDALRELEFDQRTGKLSEKDYAELADRYKRQAITMLKQLDDGTRDALLEIDAEIEQEVAARRKSAAPAAHHSARTRCVACGAGLDADDRFCRRCGVPVALTCPNCQTVVQGGGQFCPRCGAQLHT